MNKDMDDLKDELWNLIQRTHFAHISYIDDEDRPQTKMVFCNFHKGISTFYFSSNTSSNHVQLLSERPKTCVYISDSVNFKGLMLNGDMIVHRDHDTKQLLWHDTDVQYYPKGVEDEDYTVLEFVVHSGRYFNGRNYDLDKEVFYDKRFGDKIIENK
ncbi:MAG: pyridoxamine 5-phosphate oxidase [Herbinix sp.]|jgi:general stress protein 26|nr:pyridoxamine 5-phosphate oxidase [Herbinix sp.]